MTEQTVEVKKMNPPSASAGPDNAYYLKGCETVQRSPAYASCLFKISEHEAGRANDLHRDCVAAIQSRRCRAVEMRQEEKLKGEAIYYFPRRPPQAITLPASVTGEFGVRISNLTDPTLIPKDPAAKRKHVAPVTKSDPTPAKTAFDRELEQADQGYAAAINAAMAETNAAPTPAPVEAHPTQMTKNAPVPRPAMQPGESPLQYARRLAASRT